jgi:hypothetical protein
MVQSSRRTPPLCCGGYGWTTTTIPRQEGRRVTTLGRGGTHYQFTHLHRVLLIFIQRKISDRQTYICRKPLDTSPRFRPYASPRSYQEHTVYRTRSPSLPRHGYRHTTRWSDASHEGDSASNPSPISPTTPSSLSENEDRGPFHSGYSGSTLRGKPWPGIVGRLGHQWPSMGGRHLSLHRQTDADSHGNISEPEVAFPSTRRHSYEVQSDGNSNIPLRSWC